MLQAKSKLASGNYLRTRTRDKRLAKLHKGQVKRGRPSIVSQFSEVIPVAKNFIESNGYEAHCRRQNSTGTCGTSLRQLQSHILSEVPGLENAYPRFSVNTVHRMLKCPHEGRTNASRYKGYIDAKVPKKDNSRMKENVDAHFYNARVKYCLQFSAAHPTECSVYSVDNKNKVKIGTDVLAVDRRAKIRRFYPSADRPVYLDHDFPSRRGNLITPCGYIRLTLLDPPQMSSDTLGRPELIVKRSGPVTIVNRGPMTKCTVASHVNDMLPMIQEDMRNGKSIISIIADGGCDFNTGHHTNLLYYARLFKESNLDALIVTCYAPGQSAMNPIEHAWGPCTQALTSVTLPDKLPNEDLAPWDQDLTEEELAEKEREVYDAAMSKLCHYWHDIRFGGIPITTWFLPSDQPETPYNDYDDVYKVMSSNSGKKFRESDLVDEVTFMLAHIDKRKGFLSFMKCEDDQCTHCTAHPVVAKETLNIIRLKGGFPSPMTDESGEHFHTLHDVLKFELWDVNDTALQPTLGRCLICPAYTFCSKAEIVSHRRKYHPGKKVL